MFGRKRNKDKQVISFREVLRYRSKEQFEASWQIPKRHGLDFFFLLLLLLLVSIGLVMVTSAGVYQGVDYYEKPDYYLQRQLIYILIGIVVLVLTYRLIPLKMIYRLSMIAYFVSVLLLLMVVFFGESVNGSRRWLMIFGFQFQPSELMKVTMAMFLAHEVTRLQDYLDDWKAVIYLLVLVGIPAGITFFSNLSTMLIMVGIGAVVLLIGGVSLRKLMLVLFVLVVLLLIMLFLPMAPFFDSLPEGIRRVLSALTYRTDRIKAWLHPFDEKYMLDESYQIVQSMYAIASGGFFGVGLGNGTQKLGAIPEAHNDFIFAVICEEFGFFGAAIVVVLFTLLVFQGMKIAGKAPNLYTRLLAVGLIAEIGLQAIINISVTTNFIPATGIALPFISSGGSAIIVMLGAMGLVLNISSRGRVPRKKEEVTNG